MKKLLAVLLALLILGVGAAFGETTNKNFKIEGNTLVKYNGPGGEVTVPEGITVLGEWAFEDSGVTKVNLPESLEEIKSYCFFSCDELKEVTIPAGTKKISEAQVFAYCHNLPAINVEEGNTEYVSVDGVLFTADRKTLMYYPDGKKTEIYFIPEGTEQLGRSLFNKPVNLRAVVIPATLRGLENKNHFSCNPKLESIIVSYDCKKYRTFNGALYDNNGNELIAYPSGKTVESVGKDDFLPGVKRIGPWAFQGNEYLKNVELPEGATSVGWMCFTFDTSLESVTVPASVKTINGYAFADCKSLKRVIILNPNVHFEDAEGSVVDDSPNVVLCGYEDSTTQVYAEKWGLKFEKLETTPRKGN